MRHQAWLGSTESLTLYAKLEEKWAATSANELKAFYDDDDYSSRRGKEPLGTQLIEIHGDKAVLNVHGSLVNADAWWHKYAVGEVTSYAAIKGAAALLLANDDIKEIVLNVSSGGGSFSGLSSASKALRSLAKVKKLTGYTDDVAASAGYWLLCCATKVYASETAELGSIGVIAMYQDISKALEKEGIQFHIVKAGKFKDFGSSVSEFDQEELDYLQSRVDQAYGFFVKHVATMRKLSMKDNEQWAEAQVVFAAEAKQLGLVDEVADFSDIIAASTTSSRSKKAEYSMTYAEKLALIASGTSPEDVLTAEELKMFHADNNKDQAGEEGTDVTAETETGTGETEETSEAPAVGNMDMAIRLGRTEAKLEDSQAKLALLQEKNELLQAQTSSLLKVAQAAVGNLQVALQKPKEVKTSADAVIAQFDTLKAELSERFPSGRKSSTKDSEQMDFAAKIPDPYQQYQ